MVDGRAQYPLCRCRVKALIAAGRVSVLLVPLLALAGVLVLVTVVADNVKGCR